jgi:TPR repeat protein
MQPRHLIAILMALGVGAAATAQTAQTIADANRAYYFGQYKRSLALYEQLAATGNAEAAERAGFMLLQGDGLYGRQVGRDVDRATALLIQAAQASRPGAGFMLNMLDGGD